ncbi:helix-turn-helix transcriptional regulator [Catenulispora rubra]|uniref:helix-turn-helix transcriptional regulator n=1 Tax=Catenulispora rubra TaxID=280293 RepID=UPI0018925557|nr:helix-turn-helix transcriptional regulator [Catenulispora rubra]
MSTAAAQGAAGCGKSALMRLGVQKAEADGAAVLWFDGGSLSGWLTVAGERRLFTLDDAVAQLSPDAIGRRPLAACIDDVHLVGSNELDRLLPILEGISAHGLALLFTRASTSDPDRNRLSSVLVRQPRVRVIPVGALGRSATKRLVTDFRSTQTAIASQADAAGLTGSADLAEHVYELCGGNPLLAQALMDECLGPATPSAAPGPWTEPAEGGLFGQVVLTCLERSGREAAETALGLAVLGAEAAEDAVGVLLRRDVSAVRRGLRVLNEVGVVDGLRFRHPVMAPTILGAQPPGRRVELHERAAHSLHAVGAESVVIARHLVAARRTAGSWGISVLRDAAAQAVAADHAQEALQILGLIAHQDPDEHLRTATLVGIAAITARHDPCTAEQSLREALDTSRPVSAGPREAAQLITWALLNAWNEEGDEAGEQLAPPADSRGSTIVSTLAEQWWERTLLLRPRPIAGARQAYPALLPASVAWFGSGHGADDAEDLELVQERLRGSALTEETLPEILNSLRVLAAADRPHIAMSHARELAVDAERRNAPGWHALLLAAMAEFALAQGGFQEAEALARQAAEATRLRTDTLFDIGLRISRILAWTEMGQYQKADRLLALPVPDSLHDSLRSLGYLRARGRFLLATGDPDRALAAFTRIGERAAGWGVDRPALMPWRLELTEALIRVGDLSGARAAVAVQSRDLDRSSRSVRGATLRIQALLADGAERTGLLHAAVEELAGSADRYEAARAMADLGAAHGAAGDAASARRIRRRAWRLAEECHALALCEQIQPGLEPAEGDSELLSEASLDRLTASERRVAHLVGRGESNRDVAARLFLTVSTVEQHLTRIYRKLGISGRQGLEWLFTAVETDGRTDG